jgi:hypothetical protein
MSLYLFIVRLFWCKWIRFHTLRANPPQNVNQAPRSRFRVKWPLELVNLINIPLAPLNKCLVMVTQVDHRSIQIRQINIPMLKRLLKRQMKTKLNMVIIRMITRSQGNWNRLYRMRMNKRRHQCRDALLFLRGLSTRHILTRITAKQTYFKTFNRVREAVHLQVVHLHSRFSLSTLRIPYQMVILLIQWFPQLLEAASRTNHSLYQTSC